MEEEVVVRGEMSLEVAVVVVVVAVMKEKVVALLLPAVFIVNCRRQVFLLGVE